MNEKFWKITEIVEQFQLDMDFLNELETEEIICPICRGNSAEKLLSDFELEKLRLAKILFEEMEVNLPGIEVILQMRQNMIDMRKQFDDILEDLAGKLHEKLRDQAKINFQR